MRTMKHWALAAMAATALALAGCGGGGSPQRVTEMTPQEKCEADGGTYANDNCTTVEEKRDQLKMAAVKAVMAVETAVNALSTDAGTDSAAVDGLVKAAEDAIADASAGGVTNAALADIVATLSNHREELGRKRGLIAAADKKAREDADNDRKATAKMNQENAEKLFMAAVADTTRFVSATAIPHSAVIKPMYDGATKITTAPSDNSGLAEATGTMLNKHGMWSGTMVGATSKDGTKPKDTAVVYTNIGEGTERNAAPEDFVVAETPATSIGGADFGTENAQKPHDDGSKVVGTLLVNGKSVSGAYTCGSGCFSQIGAGDEGVKLTGTWTFAPNAGQTVMDADTSYAYFGWWLREDGAADARTYTVTAFHAGADAAAVTPAPVLTGTAGYTGPAVGKYAMVDRDGTHTGGHFTATANLTADFDDSNNKVTGTIEDFVGMSDWKVMLDSNPSGGSASAVWQIGEDKGTSTGSSFAHSFRELDEGTPMTLTGTWKTQYDPHGTVVGHMIGAFGATKQ